MERDIARPPDRKLALKGRLGPMLPGIRPSAQAFPRDLYFTFVIEFATGWIERPRRLLTAGEAANFVWDNNGKGV
ncbi:MAG: hypothetical protein ACXW3R_13620 [Rhodoplanes sp.]|jgi:hypothetical protein